MKKFIFGAAIAMALSQVNAAPDPNFHIYLAFGQSNMEGQGNIESQDNTVDSRFQVLWTGDAGWCANNRAKGNWYDATPPLASCDGKLGPTDYFGRTMVENMPAGTKVGVIVVAVAGCDIQLFEKNNYKSYVSSAQSWMTSRINNYGGNPYGRLIEMAKKAQEVGVIKGIIFHQGETNSGQSNWPSRVKAVYDDIVNDLGLGSDIPFLAGEVHPNGSCNGMNSIIAQLPKQSKNFYVVSAQGITGMLQDGQNVHFDAAGYRELGRRYATEMLKHVDISAAPGSSETAVESSSSESPLSSAETSSSSSHRSWNWPTVSSSSGTDALQMHRADVNLVSVGPGELQLRINGSEKVTVKVFSSLGKEVLDLSGNYSGTNSLVLGGKLSSGRYIVNAQGQTFRAVKSITVK